MPPCAPESPRNITLNQVIYTTTPPETQIFTQYDNFESKDEPVSKDTAFLPLPEEAGFYPGDRNAPDFLLRRMMRKVKPSPLVVGDAITQGLRSHLISDANVPVRGFKQAGSRLTSQHGSASNNERVPGTESCLCVKVHAAGCRGSMVRSRDVRLLSQPSAAKMLPVPGR
ncbi:hypothetical protein NDU88_003212 [Pleurodeles waltl]|uniref:Uncharacterized protein n=1 Tax=Pleurodeles waltl TaxID=8319 RepID=A0AAV7WUQ0_PLEWA|nr:hypothetical protein NDU88_003212 [Pleurodeles waltl]